MGKRDLRTTPMAGWMVVLLLSVAASGKIVFVDDDAVGAGDGASWIDAFVYLQDALSVAEAGDEVRVAQGVYRPDQGAGLVLGDRKATFSLVSGVILAGGYAGLSDGDPEARDIPLYETVLSGDLAGDDGPDFTNLGDNSVVVVSSLSNDAATVLDGFTVTGGWGPTGPGITALASDLRVERCTVTRNKTRGTRGDGGGMHNAEGNPVLKDCVFKDNLAWGSGGGFYNDGGDPRFVDCLFEANTAEKSGGGLSSISRHMTLERCTFRGNEANWGGGLANSSWGDDVPVTLTACTFDRNRARTSGGGIENTGPLSLTGSTFVRNVAAEGGALQSEHDVLSATACVFERNLAEGNDGGAVHLSPARSRGHSLTTAPGPMFARCRFIGNTASDSGGGGLWNARNATLTNCLFVGNTARDGGAIYSRGGRLTHCTLAQNQGDLVGGLSDVAGNSFLDHCIVWGNVGGQLSGVVEVTYSDIEGGWVGVGNIDVDPCFALPGSWELNAEVPAWSNGDYHLKSQAGRWDPDGEIWMQDEISSPCIDAGAGLASIGDELFPNGGIVNLGAYGGTAEASKSYSGEPLCEMHRAGDVNGDCAVDLLDLLIVIAQWTADIAPPIAQNPIIAIVEPKEGETFVVSSDPILILARVYDPTVTVTGVQFHMAGEHAGGSSSISLPGHRGTNGWYLLWDTVPRRGPSQPEGMYTVTAQATLDDGSSIASAPVAFLLESATP